jgi:Stage II sporulation protein E (SpoIIE)
MMPAIGALRRQLSPAATLAAGALLLAGGIALARARLPEWRLGPLPAKRALRGQLQAVAARAGLRLAGEPAPFELSERSNRRRLAREMPLTSIASRATMAIRASAEAVANQAGEIQRAQTLEVWFDAAGRPLALDWRPSGGWGALAVLRGSTAPSASHRPETFAAGLLAPGERLGPSVRLFLADIPLTAYAVSASAPPVHVTVAAVSAVVQASRNPGDLRSVVSSWPRLDIFAGSVDQGLRNGVLLAMAGTFLVLAIRRRISLANASRLAALAALALLPAALRQPSAVWAVSDALELALQSAWLAVLWAAAESLWRAADPRFDASLDLLLRSRRLTRRAGGALLVGAGLGAAAAGLALLLSALATLLPGSTAQALSVDLPVTHGANGPLATGIVLAAAIAFLTGCGRRLSRRRWVPAGVAIAAALVLPTVMLRPWPLQLGASALVAGVLVAAAELGGLTALLAAALVCRLLPAAAFAALHLAWLPGSFALAAGGVAVVLAAGIAGARRPAGGEDEPAPPPFILRIERERRLAVEMELLARMQRGLLPSRLPEVPGWEIAARSLLADRAGGDLYDFVRDRAGRLWIAAGDVAGHGFSCAIAQAMVKAALASLLEAGARAPGEILAETDRVLRTAAASRSFTTLALLRLEPATGEALFANAGHPYPLLVEPGQPAREVALPGLPLGQGPPRSYADLALALAPGATLVLCSDGLFEAVAGRAGSVPYGYERPRALLDGLASRPAAEVLEALIEDWFRHRGPGPLDDDTTLVVLRRAP